jgi:hypothetical protein
MADQTVENYSIKELKDSLDYAIDNFDNPAKSEQDVSSKVLSKMNLGIADANSLRWAKQRLETDPTDEDAIRARNQAFSKVASKYSAMPAEGGEGASNWHRFVAKAIPEEDQARYLQSKYGKDNVRKFPTGGIQVRKPGDLNFTYLDPYGFDLMDLVDIIPEAVEYGASVFAEGGPLKAAAELTKNIPYVGKALKAPGMASAALIGGASDIVRQGISIAGGGRETYDPLRTAQQAALAGGITGVLGGVSKLLPTVSKASSSAQELERMAMKPDANIIAQQAAEIGVKPTPGMLTKSLERQKLEDVAARSPKTLVGFLTGESSLKKQIAKNHEAINQAAEDVLTKATYSSTGLTPELLKSKELGKEVIFPVAKDVKESILTVIKGKVTDAKKLYDELGKNLDRPGYAINQQPTIDAINKLKREYKFDDQAVSYLDKQLDKLSEVGTIGDLKRYRTAVLGDSSRFMQDANLRRATTKIANSLDETRDQTFADLIQKYMAESEKNFTESMAKGVVPKNQQSTTTAMFIKEQQDKLAQASKLWREANEEIASVMKRPKADLKGGITANLTKLVKTKPEDVFKKLLAENDVEKAEYLLDKYPKQYIQALKTSKSKKLQDIAQNLDYSQGRNKLPGFKTIELMKKLTNEDKNLLLGKDYQKKYDAIVTLYREQPSLVNASGSTINKSLINGEVFKMEADAFGRFLQKMWLSAGFEKSKVMDQVVKGLQTKEARGAIQVIKPNKDYIRGENQ